MRIVPFTEGRFREGVRKSGAGCGTCGRGSQPCPRAGTGTNVAWVIRPRASGPRIYANADDTAWRAELARLGEPVARFPVERPLGVPLSSCRGDGKREQDGRTPAPKPTTGADFPLLFEKMNISAI